MQLEFDLGFLNDSPDERELIPTDWALLPANETKNRGHVTVCALVAPSLNRTELFMKIGFICPDAPGHINPITALARHVAMRNHEVVFLYTSNAGGLPCIPYDDEGEFKEGDGVKVDANRDSLTFSHAQPSSANESFAERTLH